MKIIDTNDKSVWIWIGFFGFCAIVMFGIYFASQSGQTPLFPMEPSLNESTITREDNNTIVDNKIPVLERIVMLIKYDREQCPDLQVIHDNRLLNITHVIGIDADINFVILGRYNTNDKEALRDKMVVEYINKNNCTTDQILITHNEFISLLLSYGVELEDTPNA